MSFSDLLLLTRADQPGSIILRGVIWLIGVLVIAYAANKNQDERRVRADVGWFFLFLFSIGILSYFIFGFVPTF